MAIIVLCCKTILQMWSVREKSGFGESRNGESQIRVFEMMCGPFDVHCLLRPGVELKPLFLCFCVCVGAV